LVINKVYSVSARRFNLAPQQSQPVIA
jgi:hypothetical protein